MKFPDDHAAILAYINTLAEPYGLRAEYLDGIQTVGVQGDNRSYTPMVVLTGRHPGDHRLTELSTTISNNTPVNRVAFELTNWATD